MFCTVSSASINRKDILNTSPYLFLYNALFGSRYPVTGFHRRGVLFGTNIIVLPYDLVFLENNIAIDMTFGTDITC